MRTTIIKRLLAAAATGVLLAVSVLSAVGETYAEYKNTQAAAAPAVTDVSIAGGAFAAREGSDAAAVTGYAGAAEALYWKNGKGQVTAAFDCPQTGLYELRVSYCLPQSGVEPELGVQLDGAYPCEAFEAVMLPRAWQDRSAEVRTDEQGNELSPEQTEVTGFITRTLTDHTGVETEPYRLYVTAGAHTLTLTGCGQELALASVTLAAPETVLSYAETVAGQTIAAGGAAPIVIEGESATVKSSSTIIAKADTSDASMSPASPYLTRLNYIGGTSWQDPTETVYWDFHVETAGYYALSFRYKQAEVVNGESLRWLRIDGKTPFEEAKSLRFAYNPRWTIYTFGEGDTPYYVYLEAGDHTLSLAVTMGELAAYYARLSQVVERIGNQYISIVRITGDTPDPNRDYELFNQIPGLNDELSACSQELQTIAADMQNFTGKRGGQYVAAINNMVRILDVMVERPYSAQQYVTDYYTNYSTVSSWLYEMKVMPLSLDQIRLSAPQETETFNKVGLFSSLGFGLRRFLASFTSDYTDAGSDGDAATLRLWVNWGRDQTMVLDSLIKESFTAQTGIRVKLEQVNASLINGLMANNYPDMTLYMSRTDPVNLGMRGALLDLTQFEDYTQVLTRFAQGADIPYTYNGKAYALPDSQNFFVLFYRKDILKQLGLTVPQTWDEFLQTATVIQQNNMQVYVPYTQITTATTVNSGIGSLNLYPTLMLQHGLSLYNSELNGTAMTTPQALAVFKEWTGLYKDYQFLKEADFYNRFRVGTMPLGIAAYSVSLTLSDAAPELKGRWAMANVPSTDGNGTVAGSGTGCGIVKRSSHPQEAWEFLKWWTSADTQVRYSRNVESLLGMLGRPQTSNVEAFSRLSWDGDARQSILDQWAQVQELPEIPGSYYVTRSVDQAYWEVINGTANVKDAVVKWSRSADSEITRKIREYS